MNAPHYADELVTLYHGNCLDVLRSDDYGYDWSLGYRESRLLPNNSVDAVVTDPPYDLTAGKKGGTGAASVNLESPYGRSRIGTGNGAGGFMGQSWDATGVAFDPETWRQVARVLKPGGHLLAFGGSRTWHRLAAAIEDAGFEIRDSIAWLYGSGFPKSLDVSKAIDKAAGAEREVVGKRHGGAALKIGGDNPRPWHERQAERGGTYDVTAPATDAAKQWQGWGTALKPSFEPIVVARKPLAGTVAGNVLEYGTGAINIDACRIEAHDSQLAEKYASVQKAGARSNTVYGSDCRSREGSAPNDAGRWPANVVLDQAQAQALDQQSGVSQSRIGRPRGAASGDGWGMTRTGADQGGASRFFPVFRYEAKAPSTERPSANGVAHPTVKPLDLMRWLVRLVTPPNGLVLEPFAGSGTTAEACVHEHMRCIAIEREADYLPLITARLTKPIEVGFDFTA
ncbi:DNA-methyltransferase [Mycolicibacterium fortuitum]|uniref:DNA-methyltransferase n=1 Tax=Mycolicibacterium fortuitum TaxID=1766 RepID=UPI001132829E|nr:DNA methyltransferase [Mycolicibacterium fortuitum]TPW95726.1 site-specific DNA-methyltransferase [Mycolicibacterium fortuitum]